MVPSSAAAGGESAAEFAGSVSSSGCRGSEVSDSAGNTSN